MIKDKENYIIYVGFMKDKFGDYGLIAEGIIRKINTYEPFTGYEWELKDICVSCRTMGRGIGGELMDYILRQAKEQRASKVVGFIIPNEDNYRMPKLFESAGLKKVQSSIYDIKGTERYEWLNK